MSDKPIEPPPEIADLAKRVAASSVTVELSDVEFDAYVLSARDYYMNANSRFPADWKWRMQGCDLLHAVKKALWADSIDTAHLRACWSSRKIAATWDETYSLVLEGQLGEVAVLALAEYAGPDSEPRLELHAAAAAVLARIAEAVKTS